MNEIKKTDLTASNARSLNPELKAKLKKALADWEDLSQECLGPSPEEQMLQDMQSLLKKIKVQMEKLEVPATDCGAGKEDSLDPASLLRSPTPLE